MEKTHQRPKCAYVVIFATKVRVFYDFCDKRTRKLWFLRQKCLLCDFCNKNASMLWFSRQKCAYVVSFATKERACYGFQYTSTYVVNFATKMCVFCDFSSTKIPLFLKDGCPLCWDIYWNICGLIWASRVHPIYCDIYFPAIYDLPINLRYI